MDHGEAREATRSRYPTHLKLPIAPRPPPCSPTPPPQRPTQNFSPLGPSCYEEESRPVEVVARPPPPRPPSARPPLRQDNRDLSRPPPPGIVGARSAYMDQDVRHNQCKVCFLGKLIRGRAQNSPPFRERISVTGLVESAGACRGCELLHHAVRECQGSLGGDVAIISVTIHPSSSSASLMDLWLDGDETPRHQVRFGRFKRSGSVNERDGPYSVPDGPNYNPFSDNRYRQHDDRRVGIREDIEKIGFCSTDDASFPVHEAKGWIKKCGEKHDKCKVFSQAPLPRRVLDVGTREAYLYESRGEVLPYAAMSHCWHDSLPVKTTSDNLLQRTGRLVWTELPIAFQECIDIVRSLGIRFLWIDSLCITQDDVREWEVESARMASIFENSIVTIVMHQPGPDRSSLPKILHDFKLPYKGSNMVFQLFRAMAPAQRGVVGDLVDQTLLSTRGWCFQERLLSTRLIHCVKGAIVFECMEDKQCCLDNCNPLGGHAGWTQVEDNGYFPTPAHNRPSRSAPAPSPIIINQCCCNGQETHSHYTGMKSRFSPYAMSSDVWTDLVSLYTTKSLTYQTDVLPALSGITNRVLDGKRYHGGIWESKLPYHLLWLSTATVDARGLLVRLPERPSHYICPSFLWASVRGPVTFVALKKDQLHRITFTLVGSIRCEASGANSLGQLSRGHVVLAGRALAADYVHGFEQPLSAATFVPHLVEPGLSCLWATLRVPGKGHFVFHPDATSVLSGYREDRDQLVCLQLLESRNSTEVPAGNSSNRGFSYGLVLLAARGHLESNMSNNVAITCTRVGLVASLPQEHFQNATTMKFEIK